VLEENDGLQEAIHVSKHEHLESTTTRYKTILYLYSNMDLSKLLPGIVSTLQNMLRILLNIFFFLFKLVFGKYFNFKYMFQF